MPTPMDAMLGLVVAAIGLMTFVIAFSVTDAQKRTISYLLAGLVSFFGLYYYVGSELRGYQMRARIASLQRQQQVNLQEIQKRLHEAQSKSALPNPPAR